MVLSTAAGTTAPERVMGFRTDEDCEEFFAACSTSRCWSVWKSREIPVLDHRRRAEFALLMRIKDPLKQWKTSPMDLESCRRWEICWHQPAGITLVDRRRGRQEAGATQLHPSPAPTNPL
jgi:hypothetical protein